MRFENWRGMPLTIALAAAIGLGLGWVEHDPGGWLPPPPHSSPDGAGRQSSPPARSSWPRRCRMAIMPRVAFWVAWAAGCTDCWAAPAADTGQAVGTGPGAGTAGVRTATGPAVEVVTRLGPSRRRGPFRADRLRLGLRDAGLWRWIALRSLERASITTPRRRSWRRASRRRSAWRSSSPRGKPCAATGCGISGKHHHGKGLHAERVADSAAAARLRGWVLGGAAVPAVGSAGKGKGCGFCGGKGCSTASPNCRDAGRIAPSSEGRLLRRRGRAGPDHAGICPLRRAHAVAARVLRLPADESVRSLNRRADIVECRPSGPPARRWNAAGCGPGGRPDSHREPPNKCD